MRGRRWWSAGTFVFALMALAAVIAVAATGGSKSLTPPGGEPAVAKEAEAEPEGGDDWIAMQRRGGPANVDGQYQAALEDAQAIEQTAEAQEAQGHRRALWQFAGPTNIGGRITGLAIDPTRPDTLYATAASGGVWKSTDAGTTFQSVWPDDLPQGAGAVAVDDRGKVWVGTGEAQPGGGSSTYAGNGMYVSEDGGRSWKRRGLRESARISRIVIDPRDRDRVLVAAGGPLFTPGGERGIYITENGGASWKQALAPETPTAGGTEISIDPSNPDRIFAGMWDRIRTPSHRTYGGLGSGIYRSEDGGETWTRLDNSNIVTRTPGDPYGFDRHERLGRVAVAVAPSNPQRVYALVGSYSIYGTFTGFYVSNDGGDTFTTTAEMPNPGGDLWWTAQVWVDPKNPDHVLVPGVDLERSTNGGQKWILDEDMHVDHHAIAWDPKVPDRVYEGNDGGVYRSDRNAELKSWIKATHEPYTQHYTVDVAETDPSRITDGLQDQGSIRSWATPTTTPGLDTWVNYNGGDGLYTPIDWSDQNIYYGCSQYGQCNRFKDGDPAFRRDIDVGATSRIWNWKSPLVIDPNDPATLYFAGDILNKSTNRGESWTPISPVLPGRPTDIDPTYFRYGTITTVAVSKSSPGTIYAGTDTGRLWKTEDGGATWTEFVNRGLPQRWVSSVAIDPTDSRRVYVTFTGFFQGDQSAHVYATTNGGRTWRNVSGNLPDAPTNDVVIDVERSTVYVATDVGAFALRERGRRDWAKHWVPVGDGLPMAPVHDLRLHAPSDQLFAGTFGRGTWKVRVSRR